MQELEQTSMELGPQGATFGETQKAWIPYAVAFAINAVLGLALFEWAWQKTSRLREIRPEVDQHFPCYTKTDAKKWSRWNFMIGASIFLVPKLVLFGVMLLIAIVLCTILNLGYNQDKPMHPVRQFISNWLFQFWILFVSTFIWFTVYWSETISLEQVDHYKEYLGEQTEVQLTDDEASAASPELKNKKKFQQNQINEGGQQEPNDGQFVADIESCAQKVPEIPKRGPGKVSMLVCNHTGFLEIFALKVFFHNLQFTAKAELAKVPFVGTFITAFGTMFIERSNQEDKNKFVDKIVERQKAIEMDGESFKTLAMFPEGTVSNGQYLLPFRRGAFQSMQTVRPCYLSLDYYGAPFLPSHDILYMQYLIILWFSSLSIYRLKIYKMPEFTPNEHMLKKYESQGPEPWKIYAHCVREAISKQSGFPTKENNSRQEKHDHWKFMNKSKHEMKYGDYVATDKTKTMKSTPIQPITVQP